MENQPPPADAKEPPGEPPEVEVELVDAEVRSPPPLDSAATPVRAPLRLAPAGPALLLIFVLAAAIAAVFYFRSHGGAKTPSPETAEIAARDATQNQTLDLNGASPPALHASESPSPEKIFNSAATPLKDAIKGAPDRPHSAGTINELPPPPANSGGNSALQEAAKAAAKTVPAQADTPGAGNGPAIDLSSPDAQASLESLANQTSSPLPATQSDRTTADQTAEIARLQQDVARLQAVAAGNALSARDAAFALSYARVAAKARAGNSFEEEYRRLAGLAGGSSAMLSLGAHAVMGAPTLSMLKQEFPKMRDAALAASRRENAKTAMSHLGANIANFIHLRRAAPHEGNDAASILSRSEAKLMADDLAGAVLELSALQGNAAAQAADWAAKAGARADIDAALASLDAAISARLASDQPAP